MAPNKTELRRIIATTIGRLSANERQVQSRKVWAKLQEHEKYKQAKRISIYLSTDNEIDTVSTILRHALQNGKQCFIPLVRKSPPNRSRQQPGGDGGGDTDGDRDDPSKRETTTRMLMVELSSMSDYDKLPCNQYGIKEPKEDYLANHKCADPSMGDLDLAIVPGVAFARDGRRLGHGRGYYDEYLFNWHRQARARLYTIGVAFREQIVDDPLAVDGHDYKLDEVLTSDDASGSN